jgi:hypothetical protein
MPRRLGLLVVPILAFLTLGCVPDQSAQSSGGNGPHGPPEPGANWYPGHTHWDDVAGCESGWDWGIDSTYDGGLQFHPQTWRGHGGEQFAPYAYMASRHAQITVAEQVLAGQGPGAWPNCYR